MDKRQAWIDRYPVLKDCPILLSGLSDGSIWIDGGSTLGTASDGTVVALGVEHDLKACEEYLFQYPTSNLW